MDGILVDTMPFHYEAMNTAVDEIANIELDKKTFYLLEGMPIKEMSLEIFKLRGYDMRLERSRLDVMAENIAMRKKGIFMQMKQIPESFNGVRELILDSLRDCLKAVVTGSSKQELETIIEYNFRKDVFNVIINGDEFEGKGKPNPASYIAALQRLGMPPSHALIVENAPLGVQAANNAGIKCIVVLNSFPLSILDFKGIIKDEKCIFKDIKSARGAIIDWCTTPIGTVD